MCVGKKEAWDEHLPFILLSVRTSRRAFSLERHLQKVKARLGSWVKGIRRKMLGKDLSKLFPAKPMMVVALFFGRKCDRAAFFSSLVGGLKRDLFTPLWMTEILSLAKGYAEQISSCVIDEGVIIWRRAGLVTVHFSCQGR